ncbi:MULTISPECIES: allantoinase AllB [Pseudomonas]|uniref:Allantoinase n=1 Tax=Pseudomonas citronellolis TaxID=53408 RepID=A0A127MQK0_9PSED|nr:MULTISPECIES: allantoinase AllB [Pseudomonas]AMO75527.1 Allantoinase [Pseudomonas citronellolis]ANI14353.1 allantoinase [Pseudomonas citronellolis]MBB1608820.1 allantoinase [Pseudomonas sp. UMC76]MBB1637659.1 allantoinase [Pseudomonas sp. UME83]NTX91836.1 allantoinase AllB [Pseudomonas sp. UMA643]
MFDTLIKNGLVVLRDEVKRLDLGLHDGRIAAIGTELGEAARTIDAQGSYVLPGMVDVHMHISEPGRTEWEGYRTGTRAMAAGGTTSFVEMPLNTLPATTDLAALEIKLAAARGQCYVDYAAMAGLVPWNLADLEPLSAAGVAAYKCFVATCGSDEPGDFRNVDDYQLYLGMQTLARTGDLLVVHCENAAITDGLGQQARAQGKTLVSDYVATRPVFTEVEAVQRVLLLARETGCRVHIAHCSCPEAIEAVLQAQAEGVDASCESCPHYFLLATEDLDAIGPRAKCSPPIRDRANQARLWQLLEQGRIAILGSDHSPCTPQLKASPNAFDAWGGISGCQNSVDAMFDAAVLKRSISPTILMNALATEPARRFRLPAKGEIALGKDADIAILDPCQSYTVTAAQLHYKNRMSAYEGMRIGCRITHTLVRGHLVYQADTGIQGEPIGEPMRVCKY